MDTVQRPSMDRVELVENNMSFLSLSMLGIFQVTQDEKKVEGFEYNKVKGLLAYLAVESDRPHHREVLAEIFWPDRPVQATRNSLRQALSILRNAINDREAEVPFLLISRETVQFNRESKHWLDVQVFLESINQCREVLRRGPDVENNCIHWLKQATRLYRGDFLDQFLLNDCDQFTEWRALRRDEYRRQALEALDMLAAFHEKSGELDESRRYAFRQLELDPLREEAHRRIMRINVQKGNRSDALAQFESCKRLLQQELGVEPEEETRALVKKIMDMDRESGEGFESPVDTSSLPHNLPYESDKVIGREEDVARLVKTVLESPDQHVLVRGPLGIGKTSIAIRAGQELLTSFKDGVYYVDLGSSSEPIHIVSRIAGALDFPFHGSTENYMQLVNHLRDKSVLILIDCLNLIPGGFEILEQILNRSPGLKIIGISEMEIPGLKGVEIQIENGLPYSESDDPDSEMSSSHLLFVKIARRLVPDFQNTGETRSTISRVCRILNGHPFAIEMVASWVRVLPLIEIEQLLVERIEKSRQEAVENLEPILHAVCGISWEFLTAEERDSFKKLTVFYDGFKRTSVEEVAHANLPIISSLASKSFLEMKGGGRFIARQPLVRFAENILTPEELYESRRAHAAYFSNLLEQKEVALNGAGQSAAVAEITKDLDNIRNAWNFSASEGKILYLEKGYRSLGIYFELTGLFREGIQVLALAIEKIEKGENLPEDISEHSLKRLQGQLLALEGWFHLKMENLREARSRIRLGLKMLGEARVETGLAWPYFYLGALSLVTGRDTDAASYLEKSLNLHVKLGSHRGVALVMFHQGQTALQQRNLTDAARFFKESVRIAQEIGESNTAALSLENLAVIANLENRKDDCRRLFGDALNILEESGDRQGTARILGAMGDLELEDGDTEGASRYFLRSHSLYKQLYDQSELVHSLNRLGNLSYARGDYQNARKHFLQALSRGMERGILGGVIESLLGIGLVRDLDGDDRGALELYTLVRDYEIASEKTRAMAEKLVEEIKQRYSADEFAGLVSEERMFEEVVGEILSEVQNSNTSP